MIFRTFVYMLANTLNQTGSIVFGNNNFDQPYFNPKPPFHHMLSLRMEGRCSIGATATIMKKFDVKLASEGSNCISQFYLSCRCVPTMWHFIMNYKRSGDQMEHLLAGPKNMELVLDNLKDGLIAHDTNRKILFFSKSGMLPSTTIRCISMGKPVPARSG